jgi:hypothetical protein
MDIQSLNTRIAAAFPAEPTPARDQVLYHGAYPGESELEEIKEFFACRPWSSITPKDIFDFRHALSFFSPSTLAYYTAAWMTCSLQDERRVDTAIEDLAGALGGADPGLWTQEQRSVICEWLLHFRRVPLKAVFEKAVANLGCRGWDPGSGQP